MGLIPGGGQRRQLHHRAAEPGQAQHRARHLDRRTGARSSTSWSSRATCSSRASCPTSASGCRSTSSTSGPSTRPSSTPAAPARDRRVPMPARAATTARPTGPVVASPTRSPPRAPSTRSAAGRRSVTWPAACPSPAGIAAALFQRERTGEGPIIDVSLLGPGHVGALARRGGLRALRRRPDAEVRPQDARPTRSSASTAPRTTATSRSCCCRAIGSGRSCAEHIGSPRSHRRRAVRRRRRPVRPTTSSSSRCSTRPSPAARSTSGARRSTR